MVETGTTLGENRGERRGREIMPQILEALDSIHAQGIEQTTRYQISKRITELPSYKPWKPVGHATLLLALTLLEENGEIIAIEHIGSDSQGKKGNPEKTYLYSRAPQEPQS